MQFSDDIAPMAVANSRLEYEGFGITSNLLKDYSNIRISAGGFSVGYEWEPYEVPLEGTVTYEYVPGAVPNVTAVNGHEYPDAVDDAYVRNIVYYGGYVAWNAHTTPLGEQFESDLRNGVEAY